VVDAPDPATSPLAILMIVDRGSIPQLSAQSSPPELRRDRGAGSVDGAWPGRRAPSKCR